MTRTNRMSDGTSRTRDKFVLRLPDGLREKLRERGELVGKAMNGTAIDILEEALLGGATPWVPGVGQVVVHDSDPTVWVIKRLYGTVDDLRLDIEDQSGRYGARKNVTLTDYRPFVFKV